MVTTVWRTRILDRDQAIDGLRQVCDEWRVAAAADGVELVDVDGNVGMILLDVAAAIGLNPGEINQALGDLPQTVE